MAMPAPTSSSPMTCYDEAEWAAYTEGLVYERSVHYAPSHVRRQFGVTDAMVSACLDCPVWYQRQMLVAGRCRPPAHSRPITPLERMEATRGTG